MTTTRSGLLRRAQVLRRQVALEVPYVLRFRTLDAFDTVIVRVEGADGQVGLGEAVALPGYGWETAADIERAANALVEGATEYSTLMARCRAASAEHPFAASAVATALELPNLHPPLLRPVALSRALAPGDGLRRDVEVARRIGYGYLKVKIGGEVDGDLAAVESLRGEPLPMVFDANGGYDPDTALRVADALAGLPALQWFEQPVDQRDWRGLELVCRRSRVPVVLDECIYTFADVRRAAEIGAFGVKLKLCKHPGPTATLDLARAARALGLQVVFGNGVATDVGNLAELMVMAVAGPDVFCAPSEASGFAKVKQPIVFDGLSVRDGAMVYDGDAAVVAERMREWTP